MSKNNNFKKDILSILELAQHKQSFSDDEFVRLKMTMRVCLISVMFGLSFSIILFFLGLNSQGLVCLFLTISYAVLCFLVYNAQFELAKILHTFTSNWSIFVFASYCGIDSGVHLYVLLGPVFVLSLYDLKNKWTISISIFTYIFTFFICLIYHNNEIFPAISNSILTPQVNFYLYILNTIFIIILSTILMAYVLGLNTNYLNELLTKNKVLGSTQKILSSEIVIRKGSEEKIKMMFDDLQISYDRLKHFNQMVSHNLRSPIANLIGLSQLIENDVLDIEEKMEIISSIKITAEKLDDVIKDMNQILTINKNFDEVKTYIDLRESILNVIEIEKIDLLNLNINLSYDFSKASEINSVSSFIHSIFHNLLSNAIKYRQSDKELLVKIESYKLDDFTIIVFSDNGIGIDLKINRDKVFRPYTRFNPNIEGTGIGLYLTQSQIQMLGGNIAIESELGIGTTFTISLKS